MANAILCWVYLWRIIKYVEMFNFQRETCSTNRLSSEVPIKDVEGNFYLADFSEFQSVMYCVCNQESNTRLTVHKEDLF